MSYVCWLELEFNVNGWLGGCCVAIDWLHVIECERQNDREESNQAIFRGADARS